MLISSDTLKALAPRTPAKSRNRFVDFLNEAMPRYGIDTPARAAAFLATCCFESQYFQKTKETRITNPRTPAQVKAKKYQDKYWHTGFYGRGLIQLTHEANYDAFDLAMFNQGAPGSIKEQADFRTNPELVAEPQWAVESACWYWQSHNLNQYADKHDFFSIQGIVNRGSASKEALDYDKRLALYDIALRAMHNLSAAPAPVPLVDPSAQTVSLAPSPDTDPQDPSASAQQTPFIDRLTAPLLNAKEKFQQLGVDPSSISKSSAATTILTKVIGWPALIYGFFTDNPHYLIAGIILVVVAIWFLAKAKQNATSRVLALHA